MNCYALVCEQHITGIFPSGCQQNYPLPALRQAEAAGIYNPVGPVVFSRLKRFRKRPHPAPAVK
jgi:hypothetical protein